MIRRLMRAHLRRGVRVLVQRTHGNLTRGQILTIKNVRVAEDGYYGFTVEGEPDEWFHAFDYRFKLLREGGKR